MTEIERKLDELDRLMLQRIELFDRKVRILNWTYGIAILIAVVGFGYLIVLRLVIG